MKPQLLKVTTGATHSFSIRQDMLANINNRWHYHTELELILFHKGSGTQFVGDSVMRFNPGDMVLVGANLPHYWRFDDAYNHGGESTSAYTTTIHFTDSFWGEKFLSLPENNQIRTVLDRARRGIFIPATANTNINSYFDRMREADGAYRVIGLMECLLAIADSPHASTLSSIGFKPDLSDSEADRINALYEFTLSNFKNKIQLETVAEVAGLVPNSFCRYFKSRTGKTYSQFLTEIRIGYACKLLIENRLSVKQLCFESGFNNFTCFHKNFKQITGKTPQAYQKEYLNC
ncbi:AraC family transcriptional regulator [Pontibacter beigongshangensis]|uniref:AraC family transcriptional regulator n=1 Tax=Pontibacter beigongshangensis TaxID=2574733 RepID=UPI00164FC35E|nr:AraC family transcriptional regulator [Pontibacter beigongshangensis]